MNEMIERAAKALYDKMEHLDPGVEECSWEALSERERDFYCHSVAAVFAAMREPATEMIEAGEDLDDWGVAGYQDTGSGSASAAEHWRAMIDAALNDPTSQAE